MDTLEDVLNLSWAQFEQLRAAASPPAHGSAAGSTTDDVLCTVDDETHVCGMKCEHLLQDADGGYVCRLTGRCFGQQMCAGPTDDRRLCSFVPPMARAKRKRTNAWVTTSEEVFGACSRAVVTLLAPAHRVSSDAERLAKALKNASRLATAQRPTEPCVLRLMCAAFAEVRLLENPKLFY